VQKFPDLLVLPSGVGVPVERRQGPRQGTARAAGRVRGPDRAVKLRDRARQRPRLAWTVQSPGPPGVQMAAGATG
jgi:hypothetical protein